MREFDKSYVLRVWKETKKDTSPKASLRKLQSDDTKYFSNLDSLVNHISSLEQIESRD